MNKTTIGIGIGAWLAVAGASGQDTHTIHVDRDAVEGAVLSVQEVVSQRQQQVVKANGDVVQEMDVTQEVMLMYEHEAFTVTDGEVTVALFRVTGGTHSTDGGEAQAIEPFEGRSAWVDGAATFVIEEGSLPDDPAIAALIEELLTVSDPDKPDAEAAFDPGRAVAVGESWEIDRAAMIDAMGDELPLSEESVKTSTVTLTGVDEGMQALAIEIDATLSEAPGGADMPPMSVFEGALQVQGHVMLEAEGDNPPIAETMEMTLTMHMELDGQPVVIDAEFTRSGAKRSQVLAAATP